MQICCSRDLQPEDYLFSLLVGGLSFFKLLMDGVPPHIIDSYMREVQADKTEGK